MPRNPYLPEQGFTFDDGTRPSLPENTVQLVNGANFIQTSGEAIQYLNNNLEPRYTLDRDSYITEPVEITQGYIVSDLVSVDGVSLKTVINELREQIEELRLANKQLKELYDGVVDTELERISNESSNNNV